MGITVEYRVGFKEEQPWRSPRGLQKTEIESTDFIKAFVSLKSQKKIVCIFSYYNK
jgi:hypothetical protein